MFDKRISDISAERENKSNIALAIREGKSEGEIPRVVVFNRVITCTRKSGSGSRASASSSMLLATRYMTFRDLKVESENDKEI